jgi:transcriptional regulator with XRE-family HTH domain
MVTQLGQRLRQYRELADLSQNELAKRSGVPRPTITNVESGEQVGLTLENARKLARALGVTIDMLAGKGEADSEQQPTLPGMAVETV